MMHEWQKSDPVEVASKLVNEGVDGPPVSRAVRLQRYPVPWCSYRACTTEPKPAAGAEILRPASLLRRGRRRSGGHRRSPGHGGRTLTHASGLQLLLDD